MIRAFNLTKLGILAIVLNSLSACTNTDNQTNKLPSVNTPQPTPSPAVIANKKVKLYLIDLDIQFATGQYEQDIEKWDKAGCEMDLQAFTRTLDNDVSQVYEPKTYQKYDARGKFIVENVVYYFDSQGVLNQAFNGFNHVNKQQLLTLWRATCRK